MGLELGHSQAHTNTLKPTTTQYAALVGRRSIAKSSYDSPKKTSKMLGIVPLINRRA